ncbi:Inner membrane protein YiaW [compost metagenome]
MAGWVSLFTLQVIWAFYWLWATLYRPERGWGFVQRLKKDEKDISALRQELATLQARMATLEQNERG